MTTPTAPRDGSEEIAGVRWMARMIDKARLEAAGEIQQFDLKYPCPMDQRLLEQLGISSQDFQTIVLKSQSDDDIVAALKEKNVLPV